MKKVSIKRTYALIKEYDGSPILGSIRICTRPTPNKYDLDKDHWMVIGEHLSYPEDLTLNSYVWNSITEEPNSICTEYDIEVLQVLHDILPYYRFCTMLEVKNHLHKVGSIDVVSIYHRM